MTMRYCFIGLSKDLYLFSETYKGSVSARSYQSELQNSSRFTSWLIGNDQWIMAECLYCVGRVE